MKPFRKKQTQPWIDLIIKNYGEMLYGLCQDILWSTQEAPYAYQKVLQEVKRAGYSTQNPPYQKYERAWVFKIAYDQLRKLTKRKTRTLTPSEQVMLDSNPDPQARLRHLDSYFHRLPVDAQFLIILKDRYGIPFSEISNILGETEESLKLHRSQSLSSLESWIWSEIHELL